jgi:hypothetical protein
MVFKDIMFNINIAIHWNKSGRDNMLKLKKDKKAESIKLKEEIILTIILIYINIVLDQARIKLKCNGLKNKN